MWWIGSVSGWVGVDLHADRWPIKVCLLLAIDGFIAGHSVHVECAVNYCPIEHIYGQIYGLLKGSEDTIAACLCHAKWPAPQGTMVAKLSLSRFNVLCMSSVLHLGEGEAVPFIKLGLSFNESLIRSCPSFWVMFWVTRFHNDKPDAYNRMFLMPDSIPWWWRKMKNDDHNRKSRIGQVIRGNRFLKIFPKHVHMKQTNIRCKS